MPSLANHQSNSFVRILLIGDAMTGKTGSLVSLVAAGYKLRILDLDNKLDILKYYVRHHCPNMIDNVEVRTIRDKYKAGNFGAVIEGAPKAYIDTVNMLKRWKYKEGNEEIDLGEPCDWGPDCILVIDSLSRLCDAAYDWKEAIMPAGRSGERDGRAIYGEAQDAMINFLNMLTHKGMATNIIVIAHGEYMNLPDGTTKIFPQGIGKALSPEIPQFFPNMIQYKIVGGKRVMNLKADAMINLANAAPFAMPDSLAVEDGLAKFFAVLRDPPKQEPAKPTKPASITLKRA